MQSKVKEHLANERTFLAWLRTSLAILAFGFVIERFALYLEYLGISVAPEQSRQTTLVGIGLIWLGTVLVPLGLWRFFIQFRQIEQPTIDTPLIWPIVALGALITALGLYLSFAVLFS